MVVHVTEGETILLGAFISTHKFKRGYQQSHAIQEWSGVVSSEVRILKSIISKSTFTTEMNGVIASQR